MGEFERQIRLQRFCWIRGRYGGGKTTLALWLANRLIESGFVRRVALNMPLNLDVPCRVTEDTKIVTGLRNVALVLDEAGQFLDWGADQRTAKKWFSYLRKRNQICLMPSVLPIMKYAQQMTCQRIFNGPQLGLNFWLYRWRLKQYDHEDAGFYTWWNPAQVFGLYDTEYEPGDEWYIYDFEHTYNKDGRGWVTESDESDTRRQAQSGVIVGEQISVWADGGGDRVVRRARVVR